MDRHQRRRAEVHLFFLPSDAPPLLKHLVPQILRASLDGIGERAMAWFYRSALHHRDGTHIEGIACLSPEEIRRRLPGAPEEAIKQLIAIDKQHRELLAHVKSRGSKDLTGLLDYFERLLSFLLCWNPTMLEPVLKELVDSFSRIICKGDEACTRQFEQTLRQLIKLGEVK